MTPLKSLCYAIAMCFCLFQNPAIAAYTLDMTPGVTETSQEVYDLHRLMFYWCIGIGVVVFGVMFWSILRHRKSTGRKASQFHHSTAVEIVWTVIPFLILIGMAIPATKVLIDMDDTSEALLTVKVTGSQWKWHYSYEEYEGDNDLNLGFLSRLSTPSEQFQVPALGDGLFPSGLARSETAQQTPNKNINYLLEVDEPLVIPTGKKVRFLITSDDVIHSWWVPAFATKKDAIPGFINELWTLVPEGKEGTYRGQCTELCGKDHGFMPVVVVAKSPADFEQWLADKKEAQRIADEEAANSLDKTFTMAELMEYGETSYTKHCAACHQANGTGLPPMFPSLVQSPVALGPAQGHIDIVLNGKGAMPAFRSVISAKDIAAIVTYERNAWGNDVGDLVQPSDVDK